MIYATTHGQEPKDPSFEEDCRHCTRVAKTREGEGGGFLFQIYMHIASNSVTSTISLVGEANQQLQSLPSTDSLAIDEAPEAWSLPYIMIYFFESSLIFPNCLPGSIWS